MITNVEVRTRTEQQTIDNMLRERRLRWLGHVFRMDHQRIPQQALYWQVAGYKRGPGRPRANWRSAVNKDLRKMGLTWEEAEVAALETWMVSECGPMCPVGCGMNQGALPKKREKRNQLHRQTRDQLRYM